MVDILVILLVTVALGSALRAMWTRTIKTREALIVRNKVTGNARRVEVGPGIADVLPFVEDAYRVDLRMRSTSLAVGTAVTLDGVPVAADIDAVWSVDSELLRQTNLNEILPLLDGLESVMRQRMNYVLRTAIGQHTMRSIEQIARRHNGLELLVAQRLQQLMAFLGVRIHLVRLICQPEETMLNARIAGEARAQELVALAGAFGQEVQIEALMRLEMLEAWRQSNRQPFAAFELPNPFGNGKDDNSNRMHFVIGPH